MTWMSAAAVLSAVPAIMHCAFLSMLHQHLTGSACSNVRSEHARYGCLQVDAIEEGAHEGHDEELGLPTGSNPLAIGPIAPDGSGAETLPPPVRAGQAAKPGSHGRRAHFAGDAGGGRNGGSGGDPREHPGRGANGGPRGGPGAPSGGGANGGGGASAAAGSGPEGRDTQGRGSGGGGLVLPERPMDAGAAAEHALLGVGEDSGAAGGQVRPSGYLVVRLWALKKLAVSSRCTWLDLASWKRSRAAGRWRRGQAMPT